MHFCLKCTLLTDSQNTHSSPAQVWHQAASGTDSSETVQISRVWYLFLWARRWVLSDFEHGKIRCIQRQTKMLSVFKKQNNTRTTPESTTVNWEIFTADKVEQGNPHVGNQTSLVQPDKPWDLSAVREYRFSDYSKTCNIGILSASVILHHCKVKGWSYIEYWLKAEGAVFTRSHCSSAAWHDLEFLSRDSEACSSTDRMISIPWKELLKIFRFKDLWLIWS